MPGLLTTHDKNKLIVTVLTLFEESTVLACSADEWCLRTTAAIHVVSTGQNRFVSNPSSA